MNTVLFLSTLAGVSMVLQYAYQALLANFWGTSNLMDAYWIAIVLPTMVHSVLTGTLTYSFLPILVKQQVLGTKVKTHITSGVFNFLILISFLLLALLYFNSERVTSVIGIGLRKEVKNNAQELLKILSLALPFLFVSTGATSIYYSERHFYKPTLSIIAGNIISIIFVLILKDRVGIYSAAWAFVGSSVVQFFILSPALVGNYRLCYRNSIVLKELFRNMLPLLIGDLYRKIDMIVDRLIASFLPAGSISYIGYSQRIVQSLTSVTIKGLSESRFPELAKQAIENKSVMRQHINKLFRQVLFTIAPIVAIIILFIRPLVKIFFERGAFTQVSTEKVSFAILAFIGVYIAGTLGTISANVFYCLQKTKTIAKIIVFVMTFGMMLKILGAVTIGYLGIALATSFYFLLSLSIQLIIIKKKYDLIDFKVLRSDIVKIICAATTAFIFVFLMKAFFIDNFLMLFIEMFIFFILYFTTTSFLKIKEGQKVINFIFLSRRIITAE